MSEDGVSVHRRGHLAYSRQQLQTETACAQPDEIRRDKGDNDTRPFEDLGRVASVVRVHPSEQAARKSCNCPHYGIGHDGPRHIGGDSRQCPCPEDLPVADLGEEQEIGVDTCQRREQQSRDCDEQERYAEPQGPAPELAPAHPDEDSDSHQQQYAERRYHCRLSSHDMSTSCFKAERLLWSKSMCTQLESIRFLQQ